MTTAEAQPPYFGIAVAVNHAQGAEVQAIDANSPAARAGVKPGDIIARFANERVVTIDDLRRIVHATTPGVVVRIGVLRAGKKVTLEVTLVAPVAKKKKLSLDVGDVSEVLERKISP